MFTRTSFKHRPHPLATSQRVDEKTTARIQGKRDFSIEAYQRLKVGRSSALEAFANTVGGLKRVVAMLIGQLFTAVLKSWREQATSILPYRSLTIRLERHAIIAHYSTRGWCDSTERELNNALIGRGGWLQGPQIYTTIENKLP